MSVEVTVCCDKCGRIIGGGKTAAEARESARGDGAKTGLPGGRDICHWCLAGVFPVDGVLVPHPGAERSP